MTGRTNRLDRAVAAVRSGRPVRSVSAEFRIPRSTLVTAVRRAAKAAEITPRVPTVLSIPLGALGVRTFEPDELPNSEVPSPPIGATDPNFLGDLDFRIRVREAIDSTPSDLFADLTADPPSPLPDADCDRVPGFAPSSSGPGRHSLSKSSTEDER
jgi:hypothetical protein